MPLGVDIKKTRGRQIRRAAVFFMEQACQGLGAPHTLVVIPARYASARLPGKPLAEIGGTTMIERVFRQASLSGSADQVIVATDDVRIRDVIAPLGTVVMTRSDHASGSDRVAEVAAAQPCNIVVNVQGDLPLLDPTLIDRLVAKLDQDKALGMATVAVPITSREELENRAVVKVVVDRKGRALYFSRAPIPWNRDDQGALRGCLHHVGIYAYRRETLLAFAKLEPTPLELAEKLEQLRALENGIGIGVVISDDGPPLEVDTDADLAAVREAVAGLGS